MNARLMRAPPTAPTAGTACAAAFSETFTPKREAICEINRTITGAPSFASPRSAMNSAASETALARAARTAKYPDSAASSFDVRPPNAKTSRHASFDSAKHISSPSLRAMSAIDLSMIVVETGSSMTNAGSPKAPPPAPLAIAAILCQISLESNWPFLPKVMRAAPRAVPKALFVASLTTVENFAGRYFIPFSIGLPMAAVIFAVRPGVSRSRFAFCNCSMCSDVIVSFESFSHPSRIQSTQSEHHRRRSSQPVHRLRAAGRGSSGVLQECTGKPRDCQFAK
jgi:hypothetical protein